MTVPAELSAADRQILVRALSTVVATSSGVARRPGELRERLAEAVPEQDRARLAPVLHQLAAAADEHVPAALTAVAPLSERGLERASVDLAGARGWRAEVAARAVSIWAEALGLGERSDSSQPRSFDAPAEVVP